MMINCPIFIFLSSVSLYKILKQRRCHYRMENQNFDQGKRIEPKIRVSKDGKWVIMNVPGIDEAIIKPVAYFKAIIENAGRQEDEAVATSNTAFNEWSERYRVHEDRRRVAVACL